MSQHQNDDKALARLPPLRDVIHEASLSAKKSLGQNFILDLNVTRRIARSAGPFQDQTVLEIGPGPGGLTRGLFLEGCPRLIAIEKDERFKAALAGISDATAGRLEVMFSDALTVDYETLVAETGAGRIVANLPYNIATPLLMRWLTSQKWPPWFDKIVVMVQKEVAERFVAKQGDKPYGRLAIITQLRSRARILFHVPASVFTPAPKVASALVEIIPNIASVQSFPISVLEQVTAAAFGQRRKMLKSSLSSLGFDSQILLNEADIPFTARAEELPLEKFKLLAEIVYRLQMNSKS